MEANKMACGQKPNEKVLLQIRRIKRCGDISVQVWLHETDKMYPGVYSAFHTAETDDLHERNKLGKCIKTK